MNNILIVSDSYTEHMAALSFPFYRHLIDKNIDKIDLLRENHTIQELEMLNTVYPVTLTNNIRDTYSKYVLIFGNNFFFHKVAKYIKHSNNCILHPNPWEYNPTDLKLTQNDIQLFSNIPVILLLTFSDCSSIVNTELLINKVFDEKMISTKKMFLPNTYDFLLNMCNDISPEIGEEFESDDKPKIIVKSIYWNQETINNFPQSQLLSFIEKINPNYTILCLDGDIKNNQLHLDTFHRLFGKAPDMITNSAYYNYSIGEQRNIKVFSIDCCQHNNLYKKSNILETQLFEDIISKIALPKNVYIL